MIGTLPERGAPLEGSKLPIISFQLSRRFLVYPLPELREPRRLDTAEHGYGLLLHLAVDALVLEQDDLEPVGRQRFLAADSPTAARFEVAMASAGYRSIGTVPRLAAGNVWRGRGAGPESVTGKPAEADKHCSGLKVSDRELLGHYTLLDNRPGQGVLLHHSQFTGEFHWESIAAGAVVTFLTLGILQPKRPPLDGIAIYVPGYGYGYWP